MYIVMHLRIHKIHGFSQGGIFHLSLFEYPRLTDPIISQICFRLCLNYCIPDSFCVGGTTTKVEPRYNEDPVITKNI